MWHEKNTPIKTSKPYVVCLLIKIDKLEKKIVSLEQQLVEKEKHNKKLLKTIEATLFD